MIIVPKDFEFEGTGHRGAAFEQKGLEERNLATLLKTLSNKETQKTIEDLSKIKPQAWKAMGNTIETLADFVEGGVFGGLKDIGQDFKDTLSLQVEEALSPLKNQIDQALSDAFAPIMPEIQAFTTEMADWFALSIGSWKALITGQWDDVLADITKKMPDWFKTMKNNFREWWDDLWSDIGRGDIGRTADIPGVPLGGSIGIDIGTAIVAAWTGFWSDLGWR